jgi:hypothetical protein
MGNYSGKYLSLMFIAGLLFILIPPVIGETLSDDFNANTVNSSLWTVETLGTGPSISEINQRLEITIPSNSVETGNGLFSAGLVSVFKLRGNFDVQIDFNLLDWPSANGVRSGLTARSGAGNDPYSANEMERTSDSANDPPNGKEIYLTDFRLETNNLVKTITDDNSGKLRLVRVGSLWSAYYFNGGTWVLTKQYTNGNTGDVYIYVGAWSHNVYFIHKNVKLALDNFVINDGQIIWPNQGSVPQETVVTIQSTSSISNQNAVSPVNSDQGNPGLSNGLILILICVVCGCVVYILLKKRFPEVRDMPGRKEYSGAEYQEPNQFTQTDSASWSPPPQQGVRDTTGSPITDHPVLRVTEHDVFISYSSEDKPIADAICNYLESRQIRCWVAPRDILPGMNYQESIIDAIDSSSIMVLIFSSHSNKSPHVLSEVNEAMSNEIIIIPFRIEDILPSKAMKYLISVPHWLDAMTPPLEQHIRELEETIKILIEKKKREPKSQ